MKIISGFTSKIKKYFHSENQGPIDKPLLYTIYILLIAGICVLFSGSSVTADREFQDPFYYFKKQLLWVIISYVFFLFFLNFPYSNFQKYSYVYILLSIVLLVLVFIPGIGKSVGTYYGRNFHRWISLGFFQFQPSEFAKIAVVIYLSGFLVKLKNMNSYQLSIFLYPGILVCLVLILIVAEPAFGTTLELLFMILVLIYIAGFPLQNIFLAFLSSIPLIFILIDRVGYRKKRIEVWLDPYKYRFEEGHQLVSSMKAFWDGGFFGNTIASGYTHRFLTYSHTDFILATFVEDFGFFGVFILVSLFLFLIIRSLILLSKVEDRFGFLLGVGLISMIGIQIIINLFVVTGVFPITGISLPFLSYGGSSLLTVMISLGIFLNIIKKNT